MKTLLQRIDGFNSYFFYWLFFSISFEVFPVNNSSIYLILHYHLFSLYISFYLYIINANWYTFFSNFLTDSSPSLSTSTLKLWFSLLLLHNKHVLEVLIRRPLTKHNHFLTYQYLNNWYYLLFFLFLFFLWKIDIYIHLFIVSMKVWILRLNHKLQWLEKYIPMSHHS
jgi:hypothetical protein